MIFVIATVFVDVVVVISIVVDVVAALSAKKTVMTRTDGRPDSSSDEEKLTHLAFDWVP